VVARDGDGASSDSSGHSLLNSNDATAQGFTIIEAVLDGTEVAELARTLETSDLDRSRAGARHLMNHPSVSAVAVDPRMVAIAGRFLGETAIPYKATLFDKSPARNWLVAPGTRTQRCRFVNAAYSRMGSVVDHGWRHLRPRASLRLGAGGGSAPAPG
jgi:hypothetical protein